MIEQIKREAGTLDETHSQIASILGNMQIGETKDITIKDGGKIQKVRITKTEDNSARITLLND